MRQSRDDTHDVIILFLLEAIFDPVVVVAICKMEIADDRGEEEEEEEHGGIRELQDEWIRMMVIVFTWSPPSMEPGRDTRCR